MREQLQAVLDTAKKEILSTNEPSRLEEIRVQYFGKKGELTQILRGMGKLSAEERPVIGSFANEVREELEALYEKRKDELEEEQLQAQIDEELLDVTLDKRTQRIGHRHPLLKTKEELEDLFVEMGFTVVDGPEIDSVENNFDALNSPKNHPSRDLSDTFYIDAETLLRTQTSTMQIRAMNELGAPLRIVSSGRVFRYDDVDDTHSPMFHQFEGLVVDKGISLANLIETINIFVKELFGEDMQVRYRPHYFPFTEPSTEVDVTCLVCRGEGCPACNNTGWSMELLGAGVVHPNVLRNCGIDPDVYSGFAFGMGIDRIAMVKYGIKDIRLLFENDARFLGQF
ncbi:phenylalanine--tRNA ligase subunit alpha [Peptoniphilus sp. KCTC 25270]|uniref:phenylalanine--tRNA ligase subunit alpha n=1 Tax=Peptoniphilus sp. KCTC 25270 TaxID=2897414 RepID=UPI001E5B3FA3|nr:phenylalanine--tRNA ligase subunit alpha [Peptoniphilus sp. KCTC 25270]MCD1147991.1 phenylalanine--tRNA ligase subunit alpha [Peptoniphilus sp. KCTC 25270]